VISFKFSQGVKNSATMLQGDSLGMSLSLRTPSKNGSIHRSNR
jgi:hypothetical protein